jgi:hypothetical protein
MREPNERPVCHRAEDLVTFLYNEASAAGARDFADHAAQCDACRTELAVFREVHDSILTWRHEALGSASIATQPAPVSPGEIAAPAPPAQTRRRLPALAALREFFSISPLWLRGATVFAALLLCGLVLVLVSRSLRQPAPIARNAADEKLYTQKQLEDAINKKLTERESQTTAAATTGNENAAESMSRQPSRKAMAKNSLPGHSPRVPALTLAEREQLAADLRLIPGREEAELPFVFSDEPDQR